MDKQHILNNIQQMEKSMPECYERFYRDRNAAVDEIEYWFNACRTLAKELIAKDTTQSL